VTGDVLARLRQSYSVGFLRYLSRRDELTLHTAYELGRRGLVTGVSLLDLVQIHHAVLVDALADRGAGELGEVADAAAAFLAEVLGPFEMTHRAVLDRVGEGAAENPRRRPS
jgi:Phosphoserine phosphatase RsbU, N-terminal domain